MVGGSYAGAFQKQRGCPPVRYPWTDLHLPLFLPPKIHLALKKTFFAKCPLFLAVLGCRQAISWRTAPLLAHLALKNNPNYISRFTSPQATRTRGSDNNDTLLGDDTRGQGYFGT